MFEIRKKPAHNYSPIDMLFGDLPLSYWGAIDSKELPWTLFKKVKENLAKDDKQQAIATLKEIIGLPQLESRQYLQAYYFLNELQGFVDGEVEIFGVIVEIGLPDGLVSQIGPWKTQRPAAPENKMARLNFLTSHGLHFGEASQQQLFRDPLAGKTMYAMLQVMQELTTKAIEPEKRRA